MKFSTIGGVRPVYLCCVASLLSVVLSLLLIHSARAQSQSRQAPLLSNDLPADPQAAIVPTTMTLSKTGEGGLGAADNQIYYQLAPFGYDASGEVIDGWPITRQVEISHFLDLMLPVIYEIYGPPATSYTVTLVYDQSRVASAMFEPISDQVLIGDTATYQLITHELIHAWRNDRILSSDENWQYEPNLSGFEEGFAQAVAYDAMSKFALRYPDFELPQRLYQSSNEWDYDFQNTPELRTTDFWSDQGGMLLYWTRYEVAAAAISKIEIEHPGFYRRFNAEYYRRLNADPALRVSRELIKEIIQTVAPLIEGRPASQWIDQQYVFDCDIHPGQKIWLYTNHYPAEEYFVFQQVYLYQTFTNGSDWAEPAGDDEWRYYDLYGTAGMATLSNNKGEVVWQRPLEISTGNATAKGYGSEQIDITTQVSNEPWPGGDASKFITNFTEFGLYRLHTQFETTSTVVSNQVYRVIGEELRQTRGVFGGIVGANGGQIYLTHRKYPAEAALPVVNGAFWGERAWASIPNTATISVDSVPGVVDVTYIDADGRTYTDTRTINFGGRTGSQMFLFDVAKMFRQSQLALQIEPVAEVVSGEVVYLPIALTGIENVADVQSLQFSLRVVTPTVLAPATDQFLRMGVLFPGSSSVDYLPRADGWDFRVTVPAEGRLQMTGAGLVIELPFTAGQPGCVEVSLSDTVVSGMGGELVEHQVVPQQVCVADRLFLPIIQG